MRQMTILFLLATFAVFSGCGRSGLNDAARMQSQPAPTTAPMVAKEATVFGRGAASGSAEQAGQRQAADPLSVANSIQASAQAIERKIIRNAELTMELDTPEETQRRIASIAEKHGGFVVNSESRQNDRNLQSAPRTSINVIARVPAAKFDETIQEIQQLGGNVSHRKITGQDVTEEFIDLEARTRAKRALETQFLEIMKRAQKVSDALEVQSQLAEVRGEIERLEGRRRFLENQAALSTINITLQTPTPIVAATTGGFWHSIKLAFGDGLDTAADIVLGLVRFVIVMIPVVVLILLPLWLLVRWLRRRVDWPRRPAVVNNASE